MACCQAVMVVRSRRSSLRNFVTASALCAGVDVAAARWPLKRLFSRWSVYRLGTRGAKSPDL